MTSAALAFDRLAYVDRLTSGGIDEQHARAHAAALESALGDTVATKSDLRDLGRDLRSEMETMGRDLRSEMETMGRDLRSDMEAMGRELRSEMETMGRELRSEIAALGRELRAEIEDVRKDVLRIDAKIDQVETRLVARIETSAAAVKVDILRWLVVTQVALGGFLFAALKLVH